VVTLALSGNTITFWQHYTYSQQVKQKFQSNELYRPESLRHELLINRWEMKEQVGANLPPVVEHSTATGRERAAQVSRVTVLRYCEQKSV